MKKTSKSSMKKYSTGGVKPYTGGVKPYDGTVTFAGSNKTVKKSNTGQSAPSTVNTSNNRPVQNAPKVTITPTKTKSTSKPSTKNTSKSSTSQKTTTVPNPRNTPPPKFANKQVTKTKDGKTIVTYDSRTRSTLGTYPATVRKVYDSKGNFIKGTKTTKGSNGSSVTEPIKDPVKKKTTTSKSTSTSTNKGTSTNKNTSTNKGTSTTKPKTPSYSAVKDLTGRMYPNTGIPANKKPATKTLNVYAPKRKPATSTKSEAKTVSQLWTEKTGTSWADAKKQGFTDGTAAGNIALMQKLQRGNPLEYTSSGFSIPDEDTANAMDAAYDAAYGPAGSTMRKGGRVKSKMKLKKK